MTTLPGISGTLVPSRFLADRDAWRTPAWPSTSDVERRRRRLAKWWASVERRCGPATGTRALADLVAVPLATMLGFDVAAPHFGDGRTDMGLRTRSGASVGMLVLPWSNRTSSVWRDAVRCARSHESSWCLVLAPPALSLVDARGHASRRSLDFRLPDALTPDSAERLLAVLSADSFDDTGGRAIGDMVARGARYQDRVRSDLQEGVLTALAELPAALAAGRQRAHARTATTAFDEALVVVYRILFLLFAESRELVPATHPLYQRAYAVGTLCRDALAGDTTGVWDAMAAVTRLSRIGCRTDDLIVRPFNGRLFARGSAPSLEGRSCRSRGRTVADSRAVAMSRALVSLGTRPGAGGRESIQYADLGVEQLGAVYERVLDLEPGRRKQTGTFYTPQPLAEFVVRRTLEPLVAGRTSDEILALRVVDPSMGSGAFLVAACRYLAAAYEHALIEEGRRPDDMNDDDRAALRRVVAERCLVGVDLNPVAVQLARLSLWLATLARGRPLGFLDHQLRVGNSLIGASPDDLHRLPSRRAAATTPLPLFEDDRLAGAMRSIAAPLRDLRSRPDDTVADVHLKEQVWRRLSGTTSPLASWRLASSLWCARWFWPEKGAGVVPAAHELRAAIDAVLRHDRTLPGRHLRRWTQQAASLADRYHFFHWPLEFADVFYDASGEPRASPGFDAVIGNPPWEMVRRDAGPGVDGVPGPAAMLGFVRGSGFFPSCDRGHLNLYQPFVDRALSLTRPGGRLGLVLPWGVATDDGAASLRRRLIEEGSLDTIVGLDNAHGLFPIHRGLRFAAITAGRAGSGSVVRARLGVRSSAELDDLPGRDDGASTAFPVRLTPALLTLVGGETRRIPDARTAADVVLLEHVFNAHPAAGSPSGWALRFGRELNATDDKAGFGPRGLPVLDGRHVTPFVADPGRAARRIPAGEAAARLPDRRFTNPRLAYRDVSGVGNRRCLIAAIVPGDVVTTHTLFCLRTPLPLEQQHFLCALFNSRLLDRVVRMLMGGHVTTSLVESLPIPGWSARPGERRIAELASLLSADPEQEALVEELDGRVRSLYGLQPAGSAL